MRFKFLACSLMLGLVATAAQAGTMTTTLSVQQRYSDAITFTLLPTLFDGDGRVLNGQPGLYAIDVKFTAVKNPATEKGWLNTQFNANTANNLLGSNLATVTTDPNVPWTPSTGQVDINGPAPSGGTPVYGTNADQGASTTDLQNILASLVNASITPTAFDTRNELGTPAAPASVGNPSYIGTFYVSWNGLGTGDAILNGQQYAFSLLTNLPGPTSNVAGTAASLGFGSLLVIVPEPATVSMLGLALLGLVGLGRRRS